MGKGIEGGKEEEERERERGEAVQQNTPYLMTFYPYGLMHHHQRNVHSPVSYTRLVVVYNCCNYANSSVGARLCEVGAIRMRCSPQTVSPVNQVCDDVARVSALSPTRVRPGTRSKECAASCQLQWQRSP